ncbi:MAG: hypothetical protein RIQ49_1946 [Pseudomonadota bacterium]|jgi:ribosomal protein S18 acetylase RimI-like enzyme|nr:GNAT family N-acetyltransferase [Betaproteobacteria bacterium]
MHTRDIKLKRVMSTLEIDQVRELFVEYAASLDIDLGFQGFEDELLHLPGEYASAQGGALVLAIVGGEPAGCGAMRAFPDADYSNACEMKRVFVRPKYRSIGLGRQIAVQLIDEACSMGYSCMLLDTLDEMEAARGLYESLGFEEIPPYYFNPIPGAHYLKVELT